MIEVENITENMHEYNGGQFYSVIINMEAYRVQEVVPNISYVVYDQDMEFVEDEEIRTEVIKAVQEHNG